MTVPAVAAPYIASTVLLGVAGAAKILRPESTARALQQAGLPGSRISVRSGAVLELCVAGAALVVPGPITGALVAASYGAFAAFVTLAVRFRWPISSCGCFGTPDTVPTAAHAVLNFAAMLSGVWWAADSPSSLAGVFDGPWGGGPLALVSAVVALLAYVVWTNPVPAVVRRPQP